MGKYGTIILLLLAGYALGALFPGPFNSARGLVGM